MTLDGFCDHAAMIADDEIHQLYNPDRNCKTMHPDYHSCTQFNLCTVIVDWLQPNFYRDTAQQNLEEE